jgi:sec-independent protein translocase protein TatB
VFGINGGEAVLLIILAAVLIGPKQMPEYAKKFATMVRQFRRFVSDAKAHVEEEVGTTLPDLSSLDIRQYDPRRIIRDALTDDLGLSDPKPPKPR